MTKRCFLCQGCFDNPLGNQVGDDDMVPCRRSKELVKATPFVEGMHYSNCSLKQVSVDSKQHQLIRAAQIARAIGTANPKQIEARMAQHGL